MLTVRLHSDVWGENLMTNWIMIFLTLVIALFTYLVWKVYERIAWITGAMETHSDLMLRIEARRGINGEPIKLVWWDPTIQPLPRNGSTVQTSISVRSTSTYP